jgi:solute carrier family 35 (adenosine 3'-phospho 5'-phosphosulfate transporter), member B2
MDLGFDFISLAAAESKWQDQIRQRFRRLEDVTGEDEDDTLSGVTKPAIPAIPFNSQQEVPAASALAPQQQPFFSQSTEAELYMLATNFLLYVSLVIITVIVAQIYFPETLVRRSGRGGARRHSSDDDRISSVERVQLLDQTTNNEKRRVGSDDEDEDYDLDEDEQEDTSPEPRPFHRASSSTPFEFQQGSLSRAQVLRRLFFCCVALNITFIIWGALQERMLTRRYPRYTGEYFTYSYALVFTNRFWTLIMSAALMYSFKPKRSSTTLVYEYAYPSISNMLSSWCQYEALRYVSFPATTLFKSFKLGPVMLMGKLLGNKSYPTYDYAVALMIGLGIAMFMTSTDGLQLSNSVIGGGSENSSDNNSAWTGVVLLFLFLVFDSFTSQFQSRMFQHHTDLSMIELMLATSAFSTVLSFVTLIHDNELTPALQFVMNHSEIHVHFLLFSLCSTVGQLLIFYTIKNFGAVVFTLIMTVRILLSIGLSCILYGHTVTASGFFGLCIVVGAVLYRIKRKAAGQQLLKWQGMEDSDTEKAHDLVQEWHEHVDM